jgi:hypothetical protein
MLHLAGRHANNHGKAEQCVKVSMAVDNVALAPAEDHFWKIAFGSIAWTPLVMSTISVTRRSMAALSSR